MPSSVCFCTVTTPRLYHVPSAEMIVSEVGSNNARTGAVSLSVVRAFLTSSKAPPCCLPHNYALSFLEVVESTLWGRWMIHHAEKSIDVTDILGYWHLLDCVDFGVWILLPRLSTWTHRNAIFSLASPSTVNLVGMLIVQVSVDLSETLFITISYWDGITNVPRHYFTRVHKNGWLSKSV